LQYKQEFFSSHENKKDLKYIDLSSVPDSDAVFYHEYLKDNAIDYIEAPLLIHNNNIIKLYAATNNSKFFQSTRYLFKLLANNIVYKSEYAGLYVLLPRGFQILACNSQVKV
jgi:hypothetical protein